MKLKASVDYGVRAILYLAIKGDTCSSREISEEMNVPLLTQIPLVQSICDSGDNGKPAALNSETATGLAFINLAQSVVTVVNKRNRELPKTQIVGVK